MRKNNPTRLPARSRLRHVIDTGLGVTILVALHAMHRRGQAHMLNFLREDIAWARAVDLFDFTMVEHALSEAVPDGVWKVRCPNDLEGEHNHWVPAELDHEAVALVDTWTGGAMSAMLALAVEAHGLIKVARSNIDDYAERTGGL